MIKMDNKEITKIILKGVDGSTVEKPLTETGVIVTPTETKDITSNGNGIDVMNYARVNVNVPTGGAVEDIVFIKGTITSSDGIIDRSNDKRVYCEEFIDAYNDEVKILLDSSVNNSNNMCHFLCRGYDENGNYICPNDNATTIPNPGNPISLPNIPGISSWMTGRIMFYVKFNNPSVKKFRLVIRPYNDEVINNMTGYLIVNDTVRRIVLN